MSFSLKPTAINNTSGPSIDYEAIAAQVEEGGQDARISTIIDMGVHDQGFSVNVKNATYVSSEEEAIELIGKATEIMGEKNAAEKNIDDYEEVGTVYKLPFKIVKDKWVFVYDAEKGVDNVTYATTSEEADELSDKAKSLDKFNNLEKAGLDGYEVIEDAFKINFSLFHGGDAQEVAITADLVDVEVDYGNDIGVKPYRMLLNSVWEKQVKGFALNPRKPFSPNSFMAKLAFATKQKAILEEGTDMNDVGKLLGQPFIMDVSKDGSFIKRQGVSAPRPKDVISPLSIEGYPNGVGITFANATVELLEAAQPRKAIIDRIKAASNYEGSAMKAAVEAYEAGKGYTSTSASPEEETPVNDSEEPVEAPKEKVAKKVVKKAAPAPAPLPDVDEDDIPW